MNRVVIPRGSLVVMFKPWLNHTLHFHRKEAPFSRASFLSWQLSAACYILTSKVLSLGTASSLLSPSDASSSNHRLPASYESPDNTRLARQAWQDRALLTAVHFTITPSWQVAPGDACCWQGGGCLVMSGEELP